MGNPIDTINAFKNMVQNQYGQNFDPSVTAKNMLGQNVNSPKDALAIMLQTGKINKQQYDMFSKML